MKRSSYNLHLAILLFVHGTTCAISNLKVTNLIPADLNLPKILVWYKLLSEGNSGDTKYFLTYPNTKNPRF